MTPRKKLYLHIGPPKTASSYLQKAFVANREKLNDCGVIYPKLGQGNTVIDHPHADTHDDLILFWRHQVGDSPYASLAPAPVAKHDLVALFESAQTVLLSSENFCWCFDPVLNALAEYLNDYEVHVVYFLRSWTELLHSRWGEVVKLGFVCPLPDYVRFSLNPDYPVRIARRHMHAGNNVDPCMVLDCFARHFDKDNFHIVHYDSLVHRNIDLLDFFLREILHIENSQGFWHPPRTNPSFSPEMIEILRVINQFYFAELYGRADWIQSELNEGEFHDAIAPYLHFIDPLVCDIIRINQQMVDHLREHRKELMFDTEHTSVKSMERALVEKYGHRIVGCATPPSEPMSFLSGSSPSATYICDNVWQHPDFLAEALALYHRMKPIERRRIALRKFKGLVRRLKLLAVGRRRQ